MKRFTLLLSLVIAGLMVAQETGTLSVSQDETLGEYLADAGGMSLYLFTNDTPNVSTCYDQCAENWPPLLTANGSVAGEGLDAALIGTAERSDGTFQVTYNGWPLYYYAADQNPGDVNGLGVGGVWYLVSPEGKELGAEGDASTSEGVEQSETGGDADLAQLISEGQSVYMGNCSSCHKADGTGGEGPKLVGNSKLDPARRPIRQTIHGGHFMPAFGSVLSDEDVAAVVTYIRNSWGNDYGWVTAEEVSQER